MKTEKNQLTKYIIFLEMNNLTDIKKKHFKATESLKHSSSRLLLMFNGFNKIGRIIIFLA